MEANHFLLVCLTYFIQHVRLDQRAVAVISVIGKVLLLEFRNQYFANQWGQRSHVKEGSVIEPDHFPGYRMAGNGPPDVNGPQAITAFPLDSDPGLPAI